MTDKEQRDIFSTNLLNAIRRSGQQQIDVAKAIGVSQQTFNSWCRGIALPRIGKIEKLAQYFKIQKTDLLDPPSSRSPAAAPPSPEQADLLEKYDALSDTGRELLLSRADELIRLGYTIEEEAKKDVRKSS